MGIRIYGYIWMRLKEKLLELKLLLNVVRRKHLYLPIYTVWRAE